MCGVISNVDLLWEWCDYVLFVCYVFVDNLCYVVLVVVEYGGGGLFLVVLIVCDVML